MIGTLNDKENLTGKLTHNVNLSDKGIYEHAKELGFEGTEEDFVLYLIDAMNRKSNIGYVTLLADAWQGENNVYSQVVVIDGVTENSQVDLTPSAEQLEVFYEKDLSFVTKNKNGVVTVYAIGQKPMNDYTIQVTITEVNV